MRAVHAARYEVEGEHTGIVSAAATDAGGAAATGRGERPQRHRGRGLRGGGRKGGSGVDGHAAATAMSEEEDEEHQQQQKVLRELPVRVPTLQRREKMRQKHEVALLEHLLQELVSFVYECKESLDALPFAATSRAGSLYADREDAGTRDRALEAAAAAAAAAYEDEEEEAERRPVTAARAHALVPAVRGAAKRSGAAAAAADVREQSSGEGGSKYYEGEHRFSSGEFHVSDAHDFFSSSPRHETRGARHEERGGRGGEDVVKVETLARQLHAFVARCLIPSVEKAKGKAAALKASHANVSEKLQRFEEIVERQTEQLDELQQDLQAKRESDVIRQKNLAGAMESLREENEELRSKVATSERALLQQQHEKATLEQRLQQVIQYQEKQRQKSDSTNSDSTVSDLSSELASTRRELKRLATAATQKDSLIEDLKAALAAKHEEAHSRSAEPFAPLLSGLAVQSAEGMLHRQGSSRSSVDSSDRSRVPHPRSPSSSEVQRKRRTRHRGAVAAAAPLTEGGAVAAAGTSVDPGAAAAGATAAAVDSRGSTSAPAGEIGAAADSHGQKHAPAGVAAAAAGDAVSLRWAFLAGRLTSPRGAALSFLSGNRFTSQRKHFGELMQQQLLLQQQRSGSRGVSPQVPLLRTSVTLARELGSDGFAASSPRSCLSTSRKEHEAAKALSSEGGGLTGEGRSVEGSGGRSAVNLQREQQQWRLLLQRSEQQHRDWQQLQQQREQQQMAIEEARQRLEEVLLTTQRGLQHLAEDFSGFRQQQEQQLRDAEKRRGRLQLQVQQDQEQWERQLMHLEQERQRQVLQLERQQGRDQTQRVELRKAQELQEKLYMQMEEQRVRQEEQVLQFTLQAAELQRQQQEIEEVSARKVAILEESVAMLKKTCTEAGRDAEMQQQRFLEISTQMQQLQQKCMQEQKRRGELTRRLDQHQRRSEEQQQELERRQQQVVEQQQWLTRQQQLLEQRQMEIEDRNQQQLLQQEKEEYQQVQLQQTLETCENLRMGAEQLQQRVDETGRYLEEQQKLFRQQQEEAKQKQRQQLQYMQMQIEQQREQGEKLLEEEVQKRQQLQQEIRRLQEARANLQQELRQRQLELNDQQRQTEKHKQQSEAHQNEQKRQQRQLDRQQQQVEQQQQELEEQQERLQQQKQQLVEQQQRLGEQQQKTRKLEKEVEEQRQAQRQTKVFEQQLVTAEPEQLTEGTHAAAKAVPVEKGEEIRKLQEELRRIRKEMGSDAESLTHRLREALATSERDASALAALRATREAELAAAAKHSAEAAAELQQLQMRHDCLEKAFVASQEEVGNLRRVCGTLKKELLTSKMKREKEFESYKQVIKLRNMERKKQVQQMLEVNESLAMRKEEVETRLTNQLQDFQNDIHALVRLHVQSRMQRRSASQLAADGVQQPPVSSSFATRVWRAYGRKLSESLELTDRSGSIRSTRRSGRPVDMYRPVALSLSSLCPHSRREDGNEMDGDGRSSRFSREDSGIDEGRGDNNLAMLDFLPSFMVKLRDKIFNDDTQQLSSYRQRSQRRPADAREDSDGARMTRRWHMRRSLGISTPVATPMSSARSTGMATGRGRYQPGGNGNQVHKLAAEKRPENMEPRETNRNIGQIP